MTLEKFLHFLDLYYDNLNGQLVINDNNLNLYASVNLSDISRWLREHSTIAKKQVKSFGFYDNELCIRLDI